MTETELIKIPELDLVSGNDNRLLCAEVLKMFETVPQGMTTFQIQNFILSDLEFPTTDSKWWQAKLELWVRMQNIIAMHYDHRKRSAKIKELKAVIDEIEYDSKHKYGLKVESIVFKYFFSWLFDELRNIKKRQNEAKTESLQVEIDENEFALVCIQKGVSDKLKEMWAFQESMVELEKDMTFSKINKEEQEEEYWIKKAMFTPELVNRHPEVFANKPEVTKLYKNIYRQ